MSNSLSRKIALEVLSRFQTGLELDNDTRHYIVSCEGLADDAAISCFFNDRDSDSSPVYELIFYPDAAMRYRVETLIPARGLPGDEIKAVMAMVESGRHDVALNTGCTVITLPWEHFSTKAIQYIKKLNLEVDTGIFPDSGPDDFIQERIILRTGRYSCLGETADFLGMLALRARERSLPDYAELFSFALRSVYGKNEKIMDQLERLKYFYESAVREAAEFREVLGKYSMEFVMAKKMTVPLTGFDEAAEAIRKIDVITGLVFGMTIPPMDEGIEMLLKNGRLAEI